MLSKNEIKDIQTLRHKKFREESRLFIAEGPKIISELLAEIPQQFKKIYGVKEWTQANKQLLTNTDHEIISETELERLSQLQTPNQAIAVLHQFNIKEPEAKDTLTLYLDAIQDPGNFGSIIRIADWFGINQVVCSEGCADVYNLKVVQATMASIARVNVFYDEGLEWLQKQNVSKYATVLDGQSVYQHDKIAEGIIVIGNESKGIQPTILQTADKKITIPKIGKAESLNAAVAAGIVLSHLVNMK